MTTPLYVRRETAPISVRIRARRHPCYPVVYTTNCDARKAGMLLSTISTRCIADLIIDGKSPVPLDAFNPARFTPGTS